MRLREFTQPAHTCENRWGWSRIDRVFSNMHPADVITMETACYLVPHPRHMSDHSPVAFHVSPIRQRSSHRTIPAWTIAHEDFEAEVDAEFEFLCQRFRDESDQEIPAFEKLTLWKKAAFNTSTHIKRLCSKSVASCTQHRLAIKLQFIKAMR